MTRTLKAGWHLIPSALIAFALLCGACRVFGQDVPLEIIGGDAKPVKVEEYVITYVDSTLVSKFPFDVKAPPTGFDYEWSFPDTIKAKTKRNVLTILAAPSGKLTVSVAWVNIEIDGGKVKPISQSGTKSFYVGEVKPPAPPLPPVDPTVPPVTPPPIPLPGLRVLIIHEVDAGPPGLNTIISGEKVRSYMDAKGAKGGFLALDKDLTPEQLTAAGQEKWVVDAFKRPRTSVPWIIISNGTSGFEGPLPTTNPPTDALNLIKKIGG